MRPTIPPEFPDTLEWLNTDRPLKLRDLVGRVVLLDFWTFCCINCIHDIPDMKRLMKKYPELVVIGVHSPKFEHEKRVENVLDAIRRYGIEHPVAIDSDRAVWQAFGISVWPSAVLIDPAGFIISKTSGGGVYEQLDPLIEYISREFAKRGMLKSERLEFGLIREEDRETLRFPGKIAADESDGGRLFLSDSNHHRILVISPAGDIIDIIGSGTPGDILGDFEGARFCMPQGLIYDAGEDCLYIADTGNHKVRKASFQTRTVETVAGTGQQASAGSAGGYGTAVPLSSPWDVTLLQDYLYIAMAGSHQIWRLNLATLEVRPYAGTGEEALIDGPREKAAFAQPSGITTDGSALYVADSETSAIRVIDHDTVMTLVGRGLFDFGDRDGPFRVARLQHPMGIEQESDRLYIADTFNHRLKSLNLREKYAVTETGSGLPGFRDGPAEQAEMNEPGGLVYLGGLWYIADTNNHALRIYDPVKMTVSTLMIAVPGERREPELPEGCPLPER
ncbi:MAG: redoxin domain-containing protein [Methanomicrobiaceae archaeon]|nr:redoxin domain-containing protein [Methanomicrobiaceae archaeon]